MIRGLSFALILLIAGYASAQVSCTQQLNRAEDLYTQGRLLEVEALISGCLEAGNFTQGEQVRAHKLLTKVAIFTDNEPKAEEELVNLLTVDPVHQLQNEDPNEMAVLLNKFRTWPVYRLEFYGGGNFSFVTDAQSFYPLATNRGYTKEYTPTLGLQGGARISKHLKEFVTGVEVGAGVELRISNYTVGTSEETNTYVTDIVNTQTTLRLPLIARYNVNYSIRGNFIPYVFIGTSLDYHLSAQYSSASRNGGTSFTLTGDEADLKKQGQAADIGISLMGGAGFKFGGASRGNFFFVEARFDKSLLLYNVPEERYSNHRISGDLQYVEDDIYLDMVSLQMGFIYSIFKPEKLK